MKQDQTKTKRIATNTIILYFRMLLLMAVSLYTSRVILSTLGVDDFGIYNVVGGFVAMFSIVCNALSGACSRYLNYEMGVGNHSRLNLVFSSAVTIHIGLALIILLLAESIGLWFLNAKMVIPDSRMYAAQWCYQLSLLTFCSSLIVVPYRSAIIAHEKMSAFAYISILEGIGKLVIALLIAYSPIDKLIYYAILLCLLQTTMQLLYYFYCRQKFTECTYHLIFDKPMLRSLFGYSLWNLFGHASNVIRNQGGNVLINLFFGPAINAARGIANQVLNAVTGFVANFTTAINPQMAQSYAAGDLVYMRKLLYASAKFSYFMMMLLSVPLILNVDYLLRIWLTEVPEHAATFTILMLIFSMTEALNNPIQNAQAATGDIKVFQIVVGSTKLLIIPISYVWLKLGGSPETIFYVSIIYGVLSIYLRLFLLRRVLDFDIWDYTKKVIFPVLYVTIPTTLLCAVSKLFMNQNFVSLITSSLLSIFLIGLVTWFLGCSMAERELIRNKIKTVANKSRSTD